MRSLKNLLLKEKCPVCGRSLEATASKNKHFILKNCPNDHYEKEIHPLLCTTFEFYIDNQKTSTKG